MNKVISWAVNALLKNDHAIPDDDYFKLALKLSGLPQNEADSFTFKWGEAPLESIFSRVQISSEKGAATKHSKLRWQPLEPSQMPEWIDENVKTNLIIADTDKEIESIHTDENIALALLEKYASYLAASPDKPCLPFYETIRIAAAIYICMEKNNWKPDFRLIGADLNGIQNYIFDLSESNSKGVAKLLRARSFYIGLFMRVALHFILDALNLPKYNIVVDAGGRALILAPDKNENTALFMKAKDEIDHFCLTKFNGELSVNLSDAVKLSEHDFAPDNLIKKIEALNCDLEKQKYNSFHNLITPDKWQPEMFVKSQDYHKYDNGICVATEKYPREKDVKKFENMSKLLHQQREIGKQLVKKSYLAYSCTEPGDTIEEKDFIVPFEFKSKHYQVHFYEDVPKNKLNDFYLIEHIDGDLGDYCLPRYHANYVPRFEGNPFKDDRIYPFTENEYRDFSIKWEKEKAEDKPPKEGDVMDFHTLAYGGREKATENGKTGVAYIGSDLLGVIRADVDRMGLLFAKGLQKDFSFITYATLSRHLDLFFSAYLPEIQKKEFGYIYTVYAGGDDLFLVGEWQQAVLFAQRMYAEFKNYTGQNKDINLSTAVYIMQPRHPIRLAAESADDLLKEAKDNDGDSISLFGIVLKQNEINELMEMAKFLDKKRKLPDEKSKVNSGFLHRFLKYSRMAQRFEEDNKVSELIYGSRFAYLGRDIFNESDSKKTEEDKIYLAKLKGLTNIFKSKEMARMQFPISWAILKNRKINKAGE